MWPYPFGETVTVLARVDTGDTDRYGQAVYDWPLPGVDVPSCAIAPSAGSEPEPLAVGRESVTALLTVYMPFGAPVTSVDRLIVRGKLYQVVGEPSAWRNPYSGVELGTEVKLERVEG